MEYSSPLAAMRPQPCPAWGNRRDLPLPRSRCAAFETYVPHSFDFKNMSMQHVSQKKDYFSPRPVRGSSPTSSLTADLDANFHIDQSPQIVTPRRSLFTAQLFKPMGDFDRLITPPLHEGAITPPVDSSSPGIDHMDVSPLPHKPPYFTAQVTLPSPSPEETPDETLMSPDLLSPDEIVPFQPLPVHTPAFLSIPERKRPATRPGLSRAKGYTTTAIPQRPASAETSLPPFRFGNVATALTCSSTPSLADTFTVSPIAEAETFGSMLPPPRRTSIGAASRAVGSPSGCHVRKPSNGRAPLGRPPRKQIRRSLSMFQHPDDVMKEDSDAYDQQISPALSSMMEVEQESTLKLPHFIPEDDADGLPRISQQTMADVLDSKYNSQFDKIVVIDCRFEYEYNGGHIESAVNFNDKQQLAEQLFSDSASPSNTLLVFHCEYSVHRAPLTAKYVRSHDRTVNIANYPNLSYPEVYILEGGYSKFFEQHRSKCYPQNYVEMNDQRHEQACERGMAKVKGRQKLFRAQTFAFGQTAADIDDSPTAMGKGASLLRGGLGPRSTSAFGPGSDMGEVMSYARRMASY
ncbi:hypothetical protein B0A48_03346 [Cryoendolithus antarcticus]|uniref:M-phase inducer phosphatase n=1 Tax=Cryoendolithus antarcticus TaxID=1507870 RepID=A0A1V8TJS0_9PEZI|nr:hypothetical protein B0A48_03346 [Cryoendolithus antarcticus]